MKALDVMTRNPVCCTADTRLPEVARIMVANHCGALPVVNNLEARLPVGLITDRDITCRSVAEGWDPWQRVASDCMSSNLVTVQPETTLEECCLLMEENQIRRLPVVDEHGRCVGIVAQADLALKAPASLMIEVMRRVSEPTETASLIAA